jgi:hypothetical protein
MTGSSLLFGVAATANDYLFTAIFRTTFRLLPDMDLAMCRQVAARTGLVLITVTIAHVIPLSQVVFNLAAFASTPDTDANACAVFLFYESPLALVDAHEALAFVKDVLQHGFFLLLRGPSRLFLEESAHHV